MSMLDCDQKGCNLSREAEGLMLKNRFWELYHFKLCMYLYYIYINNG